MGRAERKTPHRDPGDWVAKLASDLFPGARLDGEPPGQEREEGIGEPRDIPGGKNHQANPAVTREGAPKKHAAWRYSRADLAHGVPPDEAGYWESDTRLAHSQRGGEGPLHGEADLPSPVPVYIVELAAGRRPTAFADARKMTCPAAGSEPIMVCAASTARTLVQLLNEDTTHQARFGQLDDLTWDAQNGVITGGARLPAGASGYTVFRTQDAVYAVSETSSTVAISVILESQLRGTP